MSQCHLLKNGIMISPTGSAEVCCQIVPHFDKRRPMWDNPLDFQREYKDTRLDMRSFLMSKDKWMDGCHGCRLNEERNDISARQNTETVFSHIPQEDTDIWYATVNAGNVCNLAL